LAVPRGSPEAKDTQSNFIQSLTSVRNPKNGVRPETDVSVKPDPQAIANYFEQEAAAKKDLGDQVC
jgi:hypothetical protein